jgi:uncharacterized damage-inducible protein DinB
MYRKISDFEERWQEEAEATLKIFGALTEQSLAQSVKPGGRTLARLAWHLTVSLHEMCDEAKLPVDGPRGVTEPPALPEIVRQYDKQSQALAAAVAKHWTDAMLAEKVPMYGEEWTRGKVLDVIIAHQTHHRGQMTVLMRQAGLAVPGIYGPAYEEWVAYNMPPQP